MPKGDPVTHEVQRECCESSWTKQGSKSTGFASDLAKSIQGETYPQKALCTAQMGSLLIRIQIDYVDMLNLYLPSPEGKRATMVLVAQ